MPEVSFHGRWTIVVFPHVAGLGLLLPSKEEQDRISAENEPYFRQFSSVRSAPAHFSALTNQWVTPVKHQMQCGSCSAFTAASMAETCMVKAGAKIDNLDLSEQTLVDCGYDGMWVIQASLLVV